MAIALLDVLDGGHGLLLCLVSKHRAEGYVSDTADVWQLGAILRVDDYTAALIDLETDVLKAKSRRVRATTDGYENSFRFQLWGCLVS
jgi:hypothetical protein